MSHGHVVLKVRIVGNVRLSEHQVLLLPLVPQAAAALLVQVAFFDRYGTARAVRFRRRGVVGCCLGYVVSSLSLQIKERDEKCKNYAFMIYHM